MFPSYRNQSVVLQWNVSAFIALLSLHLVYHLCFFLDGLCVSYLLSSEFPVTIGEACLFLTHFSLMSHFYTPFFRPNFINKIIYEQFFFLFLMFKMNWESISFNASPEITKWSLDKSNCLSKLKITGLWINSRNKLVVILR